MADTMTTDTTQKPTTRLWAAKRDIEAIRTNLRELPVPAAAGKEAAAMLASFDAVTEAFDSLNAVLRACGQ